MRTQLDCVPCFVQQAIEAEKAEGAIEKRIARRWFKVLGHNISRHINAKQYLPFESVGHFNLAA